MLGCSEVPDKSYENSQDHYAAVDCVEARASRCLLPPIGDKPNQPRNLSFPSKSYGNRNRSFQPGWFDRNPWLHYSERKDASFCHNCIKAAASNMISSGNADQAFTRDCYNNWKSATEKKKVLVNTRTVLHTKKRSRSAPAEIIGDVGEILCIQHAQENIKNREVLLLSLQTRQRTFPTKNN